MPLVDLPEHDLTHWPFWYTGAVGVRVREKCQERIQRASRNQEVATTFGSGTMALVNHQRPAERAPKEKEKISSCASNSKRSRSCPCIVFRSLSCKSSPGPSSNQPLSCAGTLCAVLAVRALIPSCCYFRRVSPACHFGPPPSRSKRPGLDAISRISGQNHFLQTCIQ